MEELSRVGRLYEVVNGVKPRPVLLTSHIDKVDVAEGRGVEVCLVAAYLNRRIDRCAEW
jgi:hypothetical protein